jgi:hypothetical protein
MTDAWTSAVHAVRPVAEADLPRLASINDAAVPAVSPLGLDGLRSHLPLCDLAVAAEHDGSPAAMLLALAPGSEYASENYRWFETNHPGTLYVDRIVVAPEAHGRGIGRALYGAALTRAAELGLAEVSCEVNLDPPNPQSIAFHTRLGFRQIGELETKGGTITVALMVRPTA